jgi:hypothetical protein
LERLGPAGIGGRSWAKDEGISGTKGREKRPGLDALLTGVMRREFDLVTAWNVDRLGRSLKDLIGVLKELQAKHVDLYLHQQNLDTSTPAERVCLSPIGRGSPVLRPSGPNRFNVANELARLSLPAKHQWEGWAKVMELAGVGAVPVQLKLMLRSRPDRKYLRIAEPRDIGRHRRYPRARYGHSREATVLATMLLRRPRPEG